MGPWDFDVRRPDVRHRRNLRYGNLGWYRRDNPQERCLPGRIDTDPGVAQPPKARIPSGATESTPKTPSEPRVPQIRSETTPSRLAGDPGCSPALL
jgi:hypothetical protein